MNVHDSEKMLGTLEEAGYAAAESPDNADLIIFNTCAIRAKARTEIFQSAWQNKAPEKKKPSYEDCSCRGVLLRNPRTISGKGRRMLILCSVRRTSIR